MQLILQLTPIRQRLNNTYLTKFHIRSAVACPQYTLEQNMSVYSSLDVFLLQNNMMVRKLTRVVLQTVPVVAMGF